MWHESYDDPPHPWLDVWQVSSATSVLLSTVVRRDLQMVSMCAGQRRDVFGVPTMTVTTVWA